MDDYKRTHKKILRYIKRKGVVEGVELYNLKKPFYDTDTNETRAYERKLEVLAACEKKGRVMGCSTPVKRDTIDFVINVISNSVDTLSRIDEIPLAKPGAFFQ